MSPELLRFVLDSFAGPFYVAQTETQRKRAIEHAIAVLADKVIRENEEAAASKKLDCKPTPAP